MIYTMATVAVTILTIAGATLGVALGAEMLETKKLRGPAAGVLATTALLVGIVAVWLIQGGMA